MCASNPSRSEDAGDNGLEIRLYIRAKYGYVPDTELWRIDWMATTHTDIGHPSAARTFSLWNGGPARPSRISNQTASLH